VKVKILDHPDFRRGAVVDLDDTRALELVRAGHAQPLAAAAGAGRETR
jgi:hypothetical protein